MLGILLGTRDTPMSIPALVELEWKCPAWSVTALPTVVVSPPFKAQLLSDNAPDPHRPHCAAWELNSSECLHDLFGT